MTKKKCRSCKEAKTKIINEEYVCKLLNEIRLGLGPFSLDHHKHAENVIEASKKAAEKVLKILGLPTITQEEY